MSILITPGKKKTKYVNIVYYLNVSSNHLAHPVFLRAFFQRLYTPIEFGGFFFYCTQINSTRFDPNWVFTSHHIPACLTESMIMDGSIRNKSCCKFGCSPFYSIKSITVKIYLPFVFVALFLSAIRNSRMKW